MWNVLAFEKKSRDTIPREDVYSLNEGNFISETSSRIECSKNIKIAETIYAVLSEIKMLLASDGFFFYDSEYYLALRDIQMDILEELENKYIDVPYEELDIRTRTHMIDYRDQIFSRIDWV